MHNHVTVFFALLNVQIRHRDGSAKRHPATAPSSTISRTSSVAGTGPTLKRVCTTCSPSL